MSGALAGKVAVVTGASRGVGKGVALGLGEAGATVYITGRTVQAGTARLPGTIGETAEAVSRLGGHGIAVRCDHANDADVEALFRRVKDEQGRLDILVNNVIAVPPPEEPFIGVRFWELPIAVWDMLHTTGLRSHYVASWFAVPMMLEGGGLIVNVSSGGEVRYAFNIPYGVGKAGVRRLTQDMAHELRPHSIAVVSLWPGLVRTERVMSHKEDLKARGMDAERHGESPQFTGRAVAALASDSNIMEKTGQSLEVRDLAEAYGFTDTDGTLPPPRDIRLAGRS